MTSSRRRDSRMPRTGRSGRPTCGSTSWPPPACCRCRTATPLAPEIFGKVAQERLHGREGLLPEPARVPGDRQSLSPAWTRARSPRCWPRMGTGRTAGWRTRRSIPCPGRAINLARQGFVVFTYDMIGYDDSRQLPHTFGGQRETLWGMSLGRPAVVELDPQPGFPAVAARRPDEMRWRSPANPAAARRRSCWPRSTIASRSRCRST